MQEKTTKIEAILAQIKPLAVDYYRLTGKPLGVTGEIAEFHAAQHLDLQLADARTPGYDAIRLSGDGSVQKIQIKGRAIASTRAKGKNLGIIRRDADCYLVMVVLMDIATMEPIEIWEAPYGAVLAQLDMPGSKSRARGQLSISSYKAVASRIWPAAHVAPPNTAPALTQPQQRPASGAERLDADFGASR